jgi:hypothetical protein
MVLVIPLCMPCEELAVRQDCEVYRHTYLPTTRRAYTFWFDTHTHTNTQ